MLIYYIDKRSLFLSAVNPLYATTITNYNVKIIRVKHSQNKIIQSGSPLQPQTVVRPKRSGCALLKGVCCYTQLRGGEAGVGVCFLFERQKKTVLYNSNLIFINLRLKFEVLRLV